MNTLEFKRKYLSVGLCTLLLLFLSACEAPAPDEAGPSGSPNGQPPASNGQPSESAPPDSAEAKSMITLETPPSFPGEIVIDSAEAEPFEGGFTLPVFLQDVSQEEIVDTVGLELVLPEGIRLAEVETLPGFTAQIDGLGGQEPVIYFHPFSITADSYTPVVAGDEPIFTLIFQGAATGTIQMEGSFFQTSGTLIRTNRSVLRLSP